MLGEVARISSWRRTKEHKRHPEQLEERQAGEDGGRVKGMSRESVGDEGNDSSKHWNGEGHSVDRGPHDKQQSNEPKRVAFVSKPIRSLFSTNRLLDLVGSELIDPLQEWLLPGEVLDDAHPTEQLLQEFASLVGPDHGLLTECKHTLHSHGLERGNDEKQAKSR